MKASSKKLETVSHFLAALLPTPLAPSKLQFPLRKGKNLKHRQIKQAGRWMGVHLETFHKASVYKLFSSPLSQEGLLGPHLETSLCYWIQSLKAIKLHSKQFMQYTLPPNLECGKRW